MLARIDKELQYWTTKKLNTTGRLVIYNGVFTLATMFFLNVWGGTCTGIAKLKAKVA